MHARKVALRPENEAPRRTGQGPRGTTNYVNSSNVDPDTTAQHTAQHRFATFLLTLARTLVLALAITGGLAW